MAQHPRTAVRAVEETMDVQSATERALRMVKAALSDGEVTPAEARSILKQVTIAHKEAREAVTVAVQTEYRQRLVLAGLNDAVTESIVKEGRALNVALVVMHPRAMDSLRLMEDDPKTAA